MADHFSRNGLLLLALGAALFISACAIGPTPTPTAAPAAAVVLQKILGDCWGVTQIKELDGTRPDHVRAFECARTRLLEMAQQYPEAAEPHRVLAWGFLFALRDEGAGAAEYERAAEIYAQQGRGVDQAEILLRLALLALPHDRRQGCLLLGQSASLDPQNPRPPQLLENFACASHTLPTPPNSSPAASPSATSTAQPIISAP